MKCYLRPSRDLENFSLKYFLDDVYLIIFLNLDDVHPFKESYRLFKLGQCTSIMFLVLDGDCGAEGEITRTHELLNDTFI